MSPDNVQDTKYRWWLMDVDLALVASGDVSGPTLGQALIGVSGELDRLGDKGLKPTNGPYRLMVFRGSEVVAVRPPTVGIC